MSVLSKILGTGDVVEKGISLIDSFHTSDTEEVAAKTKAKTDLLAAYAPFNIAQRVLAFMFCSVFVLCFLLALGAILGAWWSGSLVVNGEMQSPVLVQAIRELMGAFKIEWAVMTILGFYFGGGAFGYLQDRKAERDSVKRNKAEKPDHSSAVGGGR